MVLGIMLALMGVWVVVPQLGLAADGAAVHLFTGLALGAFVFGYVPAGDLIETPQPVLLWRRFLAFLTDLLALFMVLNPVLTHLNIFGGVLSGVMLVFCYFWLHGRFGRATLGQYVMAYRIEPMDGANGAPEYANRAIMGFVSACLWPLTFIAASQEDATSGTYFWDRESKTQAVSVVELRR